MQLTLVPLFSLAAEEKKSLKRTFQQIQEEEDDDYPGSYSPQDPSAGPLLVCDSRHKVTP